MPNVVEKVVSKGTGVAKAVNARLEGLTGVFMHLANEHGQVSALLHDLKTSDDAEKREDLWTTIRLELISHERAELAEVFPVLAQIPKLKVHVEAHNQDAGLLEQAVNELEDTDFTAGDYEVKLDHLIALVNRHVEEEEHNWFQRAQTAMDEKTIDALRDKFEKTKASIMKELE